MKFHLLVSMLWYLRERQINREWTGRRFESNDSINLPSKRSVNPNKFWLWNHCLLAMHTKHNTIIRFHIHKLKSTNIFASKWLAYVCDVRVSLAKQLKPNKFSIYKQTKMKAKKNKSKTKCWTSNAVNFRYFLLHVLDK